MNNHKNNIWEICIDMYIKTKYKKSFIFMLEKYEDLYGKYLGVYKFVKVVNKLYKGNFKKIKFVFFSLEDSKLKVNYSKHFKKHCDTYYLKNKREEFIKNIPIKLS